MLYVSVMSMMSALFFFLIIRRPPRSTRTDTLFPYTTLFRFGGVGLSEHIIPFASSEVEMPIGSRTPSGCLDVRPSRKFILSACQGRRRARHERNDRLLPHQPILEIQRQRVADLPRLDRRRLRFGRHHLHARHRRLRPGKATLADRHQFGAAETRKPRIVLRLGVRRLDRGAARADQHRIGVLHREPRSVDRSEAHTSALQSLMRISYAV